jgi:8-oxo-(d)GTP phosphatase
MKKRTKIAAGGVVLCKGRDEPPLVLLIHRVRYDDWSLPKGIVKAGETIESAALREVQEETGLHCRIVRKLNVVSYTYRSLKGNSREKIVHYFLMESLSGTITDHEDKIDRVQWADLRQAQHMLSYESDVQIVQHIIL